MHALVEIPCHDFENDNANCFEALRFVLTVNFLLSLASGTCPCDDARWCDTIQGSPIRPDGEVFGFYASWKMPNPRGADMNWTRVTTVAWAAQDEVMCLAHQHGARAVISAPEIKNLTDLANPQIRHEWIQEAVDIVTATYRDGIVFDYESPLPIGSLEGTYMHN